ncbi:Putative adhesin [Dethiosulfatibacter aminovorans DSM 17477]|uniref:Putative adhesin n=1 Tax=Dethiosulfatibacter aminovorans DSM 17477 TaxID=1121476 RepID=A0A1M6EM41_9FIRM|nr:DUF4097 family beta strand repeat-containing protein [Dethiosulfatibacter aminovorans]SHI86300.1 Putative adhesin [Dethiosulfatibacter aminovorans DSM 17477]
MKERKLYLLLAIILIISLISTGCIWSINPINKIIYKTYNLDESNSFSYSSIESIEIEASVKEVNIAPTQADEFMVTLTGTLTANYEPKLIVENSGDSVTIKTQETMHNMKIDKNELILGIEVPEKYINDIKCTTISGLISTESLTLEELNLSAVSGSIFMNNITSDSLELSSVSGDLNLNSVNANNANLNTTSGKTDIYNFSGTEVDSTSVSGSINFSGQADEIDLSSTSGDLDLNLDNLRGNIDMSTVSGDVAIRIGGDPDYRLSFKTVSGDFNSNADLSIEKITNRNVTAERGNGTYQITVSTTSGSLNIN